MSKLRAILWVSIFYIILISCLDNRANATSYEIIIDPASYGNLKQDDLGGNGLYYLGPIAAVNSFIFLQNRYPSVYDQSLVTDPMATALALTQSEYMNTSLFTGTQVRDFYWGKYLYVEDQAPGRTIYAGETTFQSWSVQRPKPAWVTERAGGPSWSFIFEQLGQGADVEVLLAVSGVGVYLTLTGFHFDDADNNRIMDSGETAWIRYIDATSGLTGQSNIWMDENGLLASDYEAGCFITMAASERPVPLPSSLLLLGSGILGLWGLGRKIRGGLG